MRKVGANHRRAQALALVAGKEGSAPLSLMASFLSGDSNSGNSSSSSTGSSSGISNSSSKDVSSNKGNADTSVATALGATLTGLGASTGTADIVRSPTCSVTAAGMVATKSPPINAKTAPTPTSAVEVTGASVAAAAAAAAASTIGRTGPGMWTPLVLGAIADATTAADEALATAARTAPKSASINAEATSGQISDSGPTTKNTVPPPARPLGPTPVLNASDLAGVAVLPPQWFYPVPNTETATVRPATTAADAEADNAFEVNEGEGSKGECEAEQQRQTNLKATWCSAESMAVHYWDRSWVPPVS